MKISSTLFFILFTISQVFCQWSTEQLSIARAELTAVHAGSTILFAGGLQFNPVGLNNTIDIYNLDTESWSTDTLSSSRDEMLGASVGDLAFFAGSSGISENASKLDIYNTATGQLDVEQIPNAEFVKAMVALDDKVYIGGNEYIDIYNTTDGSWTSHQLSNPRSSMCAVAIDNKVIFGGGFSSGDRSDVVDIYDSATDSWSVQQLSIPRSGLACAAGEGKAYFIGGVKDDYEASDIIDVYDIATDSWSVINMETARHSATAQFGNGKLVVAGGFYKVGSSDRYLDEVEIIDAGSGSIELSQLSVARFSLGSVVVGNRMYFAGGSTATGVSDVIDILELAPDATIDLGVFENLVSYPNPTSNFLKLEIDQVSDKVIITDSRGVDVLVDTQNNSTIDVSTLTNGQYFIKAYLEDGTIALGQFLKM